MLLSKACAAASTIQCSVCRMFIKIEKRLAMDGLSRWFAPNFVRHMRGHLSHKAAAADPQPVAEGALPDDDDGDGGDQPAPSLASPAYNVVTAFDADLLAFANRTLQLHFQQPHKMRAHSASAAASTVRCALCERDVKVQIRKIGVVPRWVAPNFVRHMKNHASSENGAMAEPQQQQRTADHHSDAEGGGDDDDEDPEPEDQRTNSGMAAFLNRSVRRNFAPEAVPRLLIRKANATAGSVQCSVCHRNIRVHTQTRGKSIRWLVSNVLRHFNTHFARRAVKYEWN